jgi:hypothetical protein
MIKAVKTVFLAVVCVLLAGHLSLVSAAAPTAKAAFDATK